jgi:hypothetical protein
MEINGRISRKEPKKLTDKDNTENLKIHLKELKFPSDLSMKFHQKTNVTDGTPDGNSRRTDRSVQPKKLARKTNTQKTFGY